MIHLILLIWTSARAAALHFVHTPTGAVVVAVICATVLCSSVVAVATRDPQ